ncbi:ATP-dependent DNA ligase, partial [Rhodococcus indonesiensis]
MLFSTIVATSQAVGATRSRRAKVEELRTLLAVLDPGEVEPVVSWLAGEPRQGRIGVGWRTLAGSRIDPSEEPSLTVSDVDRAFTELAGLSGAGSTGRRRELLAGLLGAATAEEQDFLVRLLTGDLRQGALDGVMTDAVAAAAGLPAETVRRAFMLSGRLPATAAA